jgi:hypothetical protein
MDWNRLRLGLYGIGLFIFALVFRSLKTRDVRSSCLCFQFALAEAVSFLPPEAIGA